MPPHLSLGSRGINRAARNVCWVNRHPFPASLSHFFVVVVFDRSEAPATLLSRSQLLIAPWSSFSLPRPAWERVIALKSETQGS